MPAYICLYCICCAVNIAWLSMMHLDVNMMVAIILVVVNMTWPEEHMGTNMRVVVVVVKVIVEGYQCKNSKNRLNLLPGLSFFLKIIWFYVFVKQGKKMPLQ